MTWFSLRSGMASMGVFNNAQYPQAARSAYAIRRRKRFFSENSINRLIMASLNGCALSGLHSLCSCSPRLETRSVDAEDLTVATRFHRHVPGTSHGDVSFADIFRTIPCKIDR